MVTFLITSFFILAILAIAIYYWQKPAASIEVEALRPPPGRGLFIDGPSDSSAIAHPKAAAELEANTNVSAKRRELVERAKAGEKLSLMEAHQAADPELYEEALNLLVGTADSDPKLLALISYVTQHELPVNKELAETVIDSYKRTPGRSSTAKMLHVAALSDDAALYQSAVECALKFWRDRRLSDISPLELRSILEGEFWILSSSTRSSGAGFLLKRALRSARRELEAGHNDYPDSTPKPLN
jgi:hypothetical protein